MSAYNGWIINDSSGSLELAEVYAEELRAQFPGAIIYVYCIAPQLAEIWCDYRRIDAAPHWSAMNAAYNRAVSTLERRSSASG
jgi:hypothetical protein